MARGGANGRLPGYAMHDQGKLNYSYPNIGKAFFANALEDI